MPRGMRIDDGIRNEIIALRQLEPPAAPVDIARELGISIQTVYRVLRERQMVGDGMQAKVGHLSPLEVGEVIDAYVGGKDIQDIREQFSISLATMYDLLRQAGVPTRQEAQSITRAAALDDAVTMYVKGEPIWKITSATGLSSYTLNAELHKRGIPMRRRRTAERSRARYEP